MTTKTPAFPIPLQSPETATGAARELLVAVRAKFGFVPNLLGSMAHAPALLEGYLALAGAFDKSSFSATERQVVLLAVSFENACEYCMAAHSAMAAMQKVDPAVVAALRDGKPVTSPKLEALRRFAAELVRTRGWPGSGAIAEFTSAGYGASQALEVVLGVGVKTLSNYFNHLAATPLDQAFAPARWTAGSKATCGCDQ